MSLYNSFGLNAFGDQNISICKLFCWFILFYIYIYFYLFILFFIIYFYIYFILFYVWLFVWFKQYAELSGERSKENISTVQKKTSTVVLQYILSLEWQCTEFYSQMFLFQPGIPTSLCVYFKPRILNIVFCFEVKGQLHSK